MARRERLSVDLPNNWKRKMKAKCGFSACKCAAFLPHEYKTEVCRRCLHEKLYHKVRKKVLAVSGVVESALKAKIEKYNVELQEFDPFEHSIWTELRNQADCIDFGPHLIKVVTNSGEEGRVAQKVYEETRKISPDIFIIIYCSYDGFVKHFADDDHVAITKNGAEVGHLAGVRRMAIFDFQTDFKESLSTIFVVTRCEDIEQHSSPTDIVIADAGCDLESKTIEVKIDIESSSSLRCEFESDIVLTPIHMHKPYELDIKVYHKVDDSYEKNFVFRLLRQHSKDPRLNLIAEIVSSEEIYVEELQDLHDFILKPLEDQPKSAKLLSKPEKKQIFANVKAILDLNAGFYAFLRHTILEKSYNISQVFASYLLRPLQIYCQYASTQKMSCLNELNKSNPKFLEFINTQLAEIQKHRKYKKSLNSFLILPIQRLCRYVILLEQLLKYTPDGHVEFSDLTSALNGIRKIATHANRCKRDFENLEVICRLQDDIGRKLVDLFEPSRKLIQFKKFNQRVSEGFKERVLYLFTDCLLWTSTGRHYRRFKGAMWLDRTEVEGVFDQNNNLIGFLMLDEEVQEIFTSLDTELVKNWYQATKDQIAEVQQIDYSILLTPPLSSIDRDIIWKNRSESVSTPICKEFLFDEELKEDCIT